MAAPARPRCCARNTSRWAWYRHRAGFRAFRPRAALCRSTPVGCAFPECASEELHCEWALSALPPHAIRLASQVNRSPGLSVVLSAQQRCDNFTSGFTSARPNRCNSLGFSLVLDTGIPADILVRDSEVAAAQRPLE